MPEPDALIDRVVHAWAATDVGRKRKHNEDSFLLDAKLGLFIVADGMGGHAAGEVASAQCVELVRESLQTHRAALEEFAKTPTHEGTQSVQKLMVGAIEHACRRIHALSEEDERRRGMGTTCVALLVCGRKAVIAHVGDSRIYLARTGRVHQLTEDHSLVEEHVKRGTMTREEAERSEIRNVITRAVGLQPSVQVDTLVTDIETDDLFLLCSDGVHGYFQDDDDLPTLLTGDARSTLPTRLVDLANERGGKDNATALVISAGGDVDDDAIDMDAKVEMLRRIPLFQYMKYKELMSLLAISKGRQYKAGERIISEGELSEEMFVIFRGQVEISKNQSRLSRVGAGGHFGEMGLIDNAPRSASVDAVAATNVITLGRDALLLLMKKDSFLSVKLLWSFCQVLGERLRTTNDRLFGVQLEVERLRDEQSGFEGRPPPPPEGEES